MVVSTMCNFITGVISALSGLVFLLLCDLASGVLGISYQTWNSAHTWSSLAAIAGVGAHLALHWKWMVVMTRQMLSSKSGQRQRNLSPPWHLVGHRAGR